MNIICFSNIDWGFIAQRHHHLMKAFKNEEVVENVIFVETLGTRKIKINKEDIRRGLKKIIKKDKVEMKLATDGVKILTPKFLPFFNKFSYELNKIILTKQLKNLISELKIDINETVAWVMLPHPTIEGVLEDIKFNKVVYDCIDDIKSFPNIEDIIVNTEKEMLKKADLITATSTKLCKYSEKYNKNTMLLRNGVCDNMIEKNKVLKKENNNSKKIIGYIGTIYEWFDIDKIENLAQMRNDVEIHLYGPIRVNIEKLKKYENIKLKGVVPYTEVGKLINEFDVCLIPFKINDLTLNTNPVKLYEYFSKGKPVVSVRLPELEEFEDISYLYDNDKEFLECVNKALLENNNELCKERLKISKENTWESRVKDVMKLIS